VEATLAVFTERELSYLREQSLGRLATVRRDGSVQNNPVAFGYNEEFQTIDIGGHNMAASQKFRNVAAGSQVAFVVDDIPSLDPFTVRCLEIRGNAEALAAPGDAADGRTGPIIRIHPRRILSFGIDPDNPAAGVRTVAARG
jgi:pyridoxamine 5'-phosphate oxidase family protein